MSNIQLVKKTLQSEQMQERLKEVLGKNTAAFTTSVVQIAQSNEMLKKAEPNSIIGAAMTATTLNLPLNNALGFAYIVPFYDSKTKTTKAQFQLGAKGFRQLAIRSNQFKTINETDVREGEIKHHDRLSGIIEFDFIQDPEEREKAKVIGYVSYFELKTGYSSTFYMSVQDLEKHAKKYSQTYKKGFGVWKDNFDAMAKKTVAKLNLSKNAPLSIDLQEAVTKDQGVVNPLTNVTEEYVDNQPATEVKPAFPDDKLEEAKKNIDAGDITIAQIEEMYELTDEQKEVLS